jgi:hypothetical protein
MGGDGCARNASSIFFSRLSRRAPGAVQLGGEFGDDPAGGGLGRHGDGLSGHRGLHGARDLAGNSWRTGSDGLLDADRLGRAQRGQGRVAGEQVVDAGLVKPVAPGLVQRAAMLVRAPPRRLDSRV